MHRVSRSAILHLLSFLFLAAAFCVPAFGQEQTSAAAGKSLTVERLFSAPNLSGRLTQGIEWCPDSKRISYLDRKGMGKDATVELWTMEAAAGQRKGLVDAATLKGTMQPCT